MDPYLMESNKNPQIDIWVVVASLCKQGWRHSNLQQGCLQRLMLVCIWMVWTCPKQYFKSTVLSLPIFEQTRFYGLMQTNTEGARGEQNGFLADCRKALWFEQLLLPCLHCRRHNGLRKIFCRSFNRKTFKYLK